MDQEKLLQKKICKYVKEWVSVLHEISITEIEFMTVYYRKMQTIHISGSPIKLSKSFRQIQVFDCQFVGGFRLYLQEPPVIVSRTTVNPGGEIKKSLSTAMKIGKVCL